MSKFVELVTVEGQRWDAIANLAYGNPYGYEPILRANPQWLGVDRLPGGTVLQIPVIDQPAVTMTREQLPPWKR
ncbi:tail protein X [Leptolyngbya sp. AN02str]|uniref:tail protein X n=1 Tax=Leptolyngbya sp. AN02str TaxID=3423363 RepID=UPI003D30FB56